MLNRIYCIIFLVVFCVFSFLSVASAEEWNFSGNCVDKYLADNIKIYESAELTITGNPKAGTLSAAFSSPGLTSSALGTYGSRQGKVRMNDDKDRNFDGYWDKNTQSFVLTYGHYLTCYLRGPKPPPENNPNDISGSTDPGPNKYVGTWVYSSTVGVNVNTMVLNQDGSGIFKALHGDGVKSGEFTYKLVWQIQNTQLTVNFVDQPASNRVFSDRSDGAIVDQWKEAYFKK